MNIFLGVREIFSKTSLRRWVPAGTARKSWKRGRISQGQVFQVYRGRHSCIVVLDGGLLIQGDQWRKLFLIGCLVMTFFNTKLIQVHGKEFKKFCWRTCIQDGDRGQRGSVIFWWKSWYKWSPLQLVLLGVLFFTQYSVCVCHFLVIFYRKNADMSTELQGFLLVWCYTQGEEHWLCIFFSKKNAILEIRKFARRDMK